MKKSFFEKARILIAFHRYFSLKFLYKRLKKQQEEEYKMAQKLAEQQQFLKTKEIEDKKREEIQKKQEEEEKINIEKIKKAAILQKRTKLQSEPSLSDPEILEVLFRLPNGAKISRRFRKSEPIEVFMSFSFKKTRFFYFLCFSSLKKLIFFFPNLSCFSMKYPLRYFL